MGRSSPKNRREYNRKYCLEHGDVIRAQKKEHYLLNKDKIKQSRKTVQGRYSSYKENAKRRKVKMELTFEQFDCLTSQPCVYCGGWSELEPAPYTGLDRIANDQGYTVDNCVPCCETHNMMRKRLPIMAFLDAVVAVSDRM